MSCININDAFHLEKMRFVRTLTSVCNTFFFRSNEMNIFVPVQWLYLGIFLVFNYAVCLIVLCLVFIHLTKTQMKHEYLQALLTE